MSASSDLMPLASPRARITLVVLAFVLLLCVPGAPDSRFSGVPLSRLAFGLLAATLVASAALTLFPPRTRVSARWILGLVVLAALKVAMAQGATPTGWRGVYRMTGTPDLPLPFLAATSIRPFRIDPQIQFNGPTFNMPAFNDFVRYGRHYGRLPREVEFPFRVRWTGYLSVDHGQALSMTAQCTGSLSVAVDGIGVWDEPCPQGPFALTTGPLAGRPHEIVVDYVKPPNTLGMVSLTPQSAALVRPAPSMRGADRRSARLTLWTTVFGWAACALVVTAFLRAYSPLSAVWREIWGDGFARLATMAAFAVLVGCAWVGSLDYRNVTTQMGTGDDPLAYEGNARDIIFHGLLMPSGDPIGHGRPFYFYPFYSYVLAGAHVIFGEDMSAAVFLNGVAIASLILMAWWLGWRHLPRWAAISGIIVMGVFCWRLYFPYSKTAFTDSLFAAMALLAVCASVRAVTSWSWRAWVLAGIAAAAAAATRPSFMTYPGVLGGLMLIGWTDQPFRSRVQAVLALGAGFLIGLAPFALRNWIVSGKFVLLVNSWIQIPYFLYAPGEPNKAKQVEGLGEALQQAWHIVAARPAAVLAVELRKLGFTLGMLRLGPDSERTHPEFVILSVLFIAALLLRRMPRRLAFVLGAFALSHTLAMILAAPWTYGYKTILPLQAAFIVGATFMLAKARPETSRAPQRGVESDRSAH